MIRSICAFMVLGLAGAEATMLPQWCRFLTSAGNQPILLLASASAPRSIGK